MTKINRRKVLAASGTALLGGLAGCSGDDDGDGSDDSGSSEDGGSTDGGESDPIKLGLLNFEAFEFSRDFTQAIEFAIDQQNNEGGVLGREVEYVSGDTQAEPQTGVSETRRLVSSENVDFLIGGFTSEVSLAIQQEIAGEGPVFMGTGARSPTLSERVGNDPDNFKYYFASPPRSPTQFDAIAKYAEEVVLPQTGASTIAAPTEDLEWSTGYADRLDSALDVEILQNRFPFDTTDYSSVFAEANNSGADILMPLLASASSVPLVNQWAQSEVEMPMSGLIPVAGLPNFPEVVNDGAAASVASTNIGTVRAPITDVSLDFFDEFVSRNDREPPTSSWLMYDGAQALFSAVSDAGTTDSDAVVESLREGTFTGASGILDFQGVDEEYPHSARFGPDFIDYVLRQWQRIDGTVQKAILAPDDIADFDGEQDFVLPEWMR
jgi:branched-chain amino acid transport system substrate-binding protein